jgi:hypothetical protein
MITFDEAIASVGRTRYDTSHLKPRTIAGILSEARNYAIESLHNIRASHGRLPPIQFDLVDDPELNAGAFRYKGEYFIFVNIGAIGLFWLFFLRLLADRRFFPEIGNPKVEREALPTLGPFKLDASRMKDAFEFVDSPVDQERIDFSRALIFWAFSFLFAHELTHVLDGHLDFQSKTATSFYAEFNNGLSVDPIERQSLELDADHGAVCAEILQLLRKVADNPNQDPQLSNSQFLNPRHALFAWFFSIHTLFRLFGDSTFTPVDLARSSYPPPRMRQWWTSQTAERQLATKSKRPDLAPICRIVSNSAMLLADEAFSMLTRSAPSREGIKDADTHGDRYSSERYWYWKNVLRPKLHPYAMLNLPK